MGRHSPNQYHGGAGSPGQIRANSHGNLFEFKETHTAKGMSRGYWKQIQPKKSSYDKNNEEELKRMRGELDALRRQKAAPAPKPKPKGGHQINPVQHSPEIQSAKEKADAWKNGSQYDYSSMFQSDKNGTFEGFEIGGKGEEKSFDPMKYLQDFTGSGQQQKEQNAQTHEVEASAMSAQEILRRDKEQGWV